MSGLRLEKESDEGGSMRFRLDAYPVDFPLEVLHAYYREGRLRFPDFQRKYVWDHAKASQLIESFLAGLPVPGVFLFQKKDDDKFDVVDGQQRLQSVFNFFEGHFPRKRSFALVGVGDAWAKKTYAELPSQDQNRLKTTVLRATVLKQLDRDDRTAVFEVFRRLNTGGVALNDQEVRNCVSNSGMRETLRQVNKDANWRIILGKESPDPRSTDEELILRCMALAEDSEHYAKPMRRFLDNFMANPGDQQKIAEETVRTFRVIADNLGPKPFHIRLGLNPSALDSVFAALYGRRNIPGNLAARYQRLVSNADFQLMTKEATTDPGVVKKRHQLATDVLLG